MQKSTTRRELSRKASEIIDLVEETILDQNPELADLIPKVDSEGNTINTFLYGTAYYDLEDKIIEVLGGDAPI